MNLYKLSEGTAARRRVYLHLVDATDGITAETGEAGGQPQVAVNGASFASTSATLTAIGNGAYYVELTAAELGAVGFNIVRYKSANTAEFQALIQVVSFDPYDAVRAGLTALPNVAAGAAGGLATDTDGNGRVRIVDGTASGELDTASGKVLLQDGAITATVLGADCITAAKIATGAIDADALAADCITAAKIADGAIDAGALAADCITAAKIADGAIDAATFAAGAITSTVIATGAIDADALAADVVTDIWMGTALTEAYATDGAAATPAQLLYMIWSALAEFAISSTTITAKKLDGSTTAMTFTLDSATAPTSRTRAT